MGQFRSEIPGQDSWIHELARGEIHPEADALIQRGGAFDPQQLIEESTISFLNQMRECFNEWSRALNTYSEEGTRFSEVKIYSVAQTPADFMVYRNQIKLLVSNAAHGVIACTYAHHMRGSLSVDGQNVNTPGMTDASNELTAVLGPFQQVYWSHQGEKVTAEQVSRFHFAEFIRASRKASKVEPSNELLLKQIKSLLKEKGLDI